VKPTVARYPALLLCACAALSATACGKRGNPMPPLQRIPAAPRDLAVTRIDDQVYLRFTVPTANVDGVEPGDVARVELYAITLDRDPRVLAGLQPEEVRKLSTLVGSEPVRRRLPAPPPVKEGMPPIPLPPPEPGVDQGAVVVIREALTPELRVPATVPETDEERQRRATQDVQTPRPLVAPVSAASPQRYYYGVAVSARGRRGPHSGMLPAPLGPTSGAPLQPVVEVKETAVTVRWTPPSDARGGNKIVDPDVLPSRSLTPAPPATTYDVYEVPRNASADAPLAVPTPLTASPVTATEFTQQNITLGTERCFYVRAVDIVEGVNVRGPASAPVCAPFADTFAPSPARDLLAASVPGAISLIWEASDAKDVAGYLVLRGEAGSATLTPLTTTPTTALRYRDETVKSGVRYVYAVVAVDKSGNRSDESNRAEETAR
jgi:hypothetical protein